MAVWIGLLIFLVSATDGAAARPPSECQRYVTTSTAFEEDVRSRGARAVIADWINRVEPDQVAHAWDCLLAAIGGADQGWLDVGSLLWAAADGASAEDLMWAFATAVDTNPEAALRHFNSHVVQRLEVVCSVDTLPIERTIQEARVLFARRRNRVRKVKASDLRTSVDACLRQVREGEAELSHEQR